MGQATMRLVTAWIGVGGLVLACSSESSDLGGRTDGGSEPSPGSSGTSGTSGDPASSGGTSAGDSGLASGDVVWIETPEISHEKDYLDLTSSLNAAVSKNWITPTNYADGDITVRIELVSVGAGTTFPIYYLVGWGPGDGSEGYIRGGVQFDKLGVLEERVPVKEFQRVVDGRDSGNVGAMWPWSNAFGTVNADAFGGGIKYPVKARVRFTLHPKR